MVAKSCAKKRLRRPRWLNRSGLRTILIGGIFFIPLPLALILSKLAHLPPAIGPIPVAVCAIGIVLCASSPFGEAARRPRLAVGFYLAMTFCIPLALFLFWPREWFAMGVLGGQVLGAAILTFCLMLVLGKLDPFGNNIRNVGDADLRKAIWGLAVQLLFWNVLVTLVGGTPCTSGGRCKTGEALFGTHQGLFSSYWISCIVCTVCVAGLPRFAFEFVARARRNPNARAD
jgi:hypothetical protein